MVQKSSQNQQKWVNFHPIPAASRAVPGDFDGELLLPTLQAYGAGRGVTIVQGRELRDDLLLAGKNWAIRKIEHGTQKGSYRGISTRDVLY